MYIEHNSGVSKKKPKFKVHNCSRFSKYKNIFTKDYVTNWTEETFSIKEVKIIVPCSNVVEDLNGNVLEGNFYEKYNFFTSKQLL